MTTATLQLRNPTTGATSTLAVPLTMGPPVATGGRKPFIGAWVNPDTLAGWQADEAKVGTMRALKTYNSNMPSSWAQINTLGLDSRCQINATIKPVLTDVVSGTLDGQWKAFINSIPVVHMSDQYGNPRPSRLLQFWGEAKHDAVNIPNWKVGALRWGSILKSMNRPDLAFGVCLQDLNWPIKGGSWNGNNTIAQYYEPKFVGVLDFIGVDTYAEFPGEPGNFGFIAQGLNLVANTNMIIAYFKANWSGIRIVISEVGFGEDPGGATPTKATLLNEFYGAHVAGGITESIYYFDAGADPLNTSLTAVAAFAAINADSKAV